MHCALQAYIKSVPGHSRCPRTLLDIRRPFAMASQYPQYPLDQPSAYGSQRSIIGPYSSLQTGQVPYAPQGISPQYRVDAYGRSVAQERINSQSYPATRGQSNQYSGNPSINSPMYPSQDMARGYSSQSTGTSGSFPSPQSSTAGPKE